MKPTSKYIIGAAAALCCATSAAATGTSADENGKLTFLLTGASFAVPENGWFEIGCEDLGAEAINKAVSGEAIYHTARRMNLGTFYTTEELDRTDVFVIGHVHNQNVANEQWLKESWEEYTSIASTTDYSVAYDYVIKRYIADCEALKDNPESKYYGTENGKPARIMLCTHWHDSRTTYNPAIRKLAEKWGFPLVKFDDNIGFSRLDAATPEEQPSLGYAHDTETINGIKYGWHPLRGSNSHIQRRMAQIFVEEACAFLGLDIPFDYALTPASPLVVKGETARVLANFTAGHYPFYIDGQEVSDCPYFLETENVESDITFKVSTVTDSKGTEALSGTRRATVMVADKTIPCSYDSFVHQAEQSKGHADSQTLDLKDGDGWSRRIYMTFPLADVPDDAARIGIRLYYESVVPGKLNNENRPLNGIETLNLGGNTSTYTANLTWDNHHNHVFEHITSAQLTQNMLESYVGWDVTDFVKDKIAEGASHVTFRVTTPYQWRALSRFTSSESTANPGKGPHMLVASHRGTTGMDTAADHGGNVSVDGLAICNPSGLQVAVFSTDGRPMLRSTRDHISLARLAPGMYLALAGDKALKFIIR
ncbi:MAG: DUF5040 domain-containing protein [Muribaculaceae bacterium]|nr:DUF5040 domain-containing protein [Muribaculaceae bacterium]MDE7141983.1 DUF5040 domain-containing protein [Muribaculaceae bacterium]